MNDKTLDEVTLPSGDVVYSKPMTVGAIRRAIAQSKDKANKNKQDDEKLTDLVIAGTIVHQDGSPFFADIADILEVPQPDFMALQRLSLRTNGMGGDEAEDVAGN